MKLLFCLMLMVIVGGCIQLYAGNIINDEIAYTKGVVMIDGNSGRILFGQDEHKILPMASTTKIMTAWLAVEQAKLDEYFTVDANAILVEGTSMGLRTGDQVSLRGLAYGMLMSSGNDAANAAAVHIAGSIPLFVDKMNERAVDIGMKNTHFITPSGLDGKGHQSTAYDMALLAQHALQNDDFKEIASLSKAKVEYGNPPYGRWLSNHNRLLTEYQGTIGVKTGYTKKAGRCLVSSAERDGIRLIVVTLGASDDWNVHKRLFDKGFETLSPISVLAYVPKLSLPIVGSKSQSSVEIIPQNMYVALTQSEIGKIQTEIYLKPFEYSPIRSDTVCGEVHFLVDDVIVAKTALIVK